MLRLQNNFTLAGFPKKQANGTDSHQKAICPSDLGKSASRKTASALDG